MKGVAHGSHPEPVSSGERFGPYRSGSRGLRFLRRGVAQSIGLAMKPDIHRKKPWRISATRTSIERRSLRHETVCVLATNAGLTDASISSRFQHPLASPPDSGIESSIT